jgi:hypothetical protein
MTWADNLLLELGQPVIYLVLLVGTIRVLYDHIYPMLPVNPLAMLACLVFDTRQVC